MERHYRVTLVLFLVALLTFTPPIHPTHAFGGSSLAGVWCGITSFFGFTCDTKSEILTSDPVPEVSVVNPSPLPTPADDYQIVNAVSETPAQNITIVEEHNTYNTNPTNVIYQTPSPAIPSNITLLELLHQLTIIVDKTENQNGNVSRDLFNKQIDQVFDSNGESVDDLEEDTSARFTSISAALTTDLLTVTGNADIDGNTTVGGDLNVNGSITAGILNVSALASAGALVAPYFTATSTTDVNTFMGNMGIGTTTPAEKLTVIGHAYLGGNFTLTGAFKDSTNATGTLGMILKTTGTSTQWVATSTLGLGNGTFLGLSDTQNSFTANRLIFVNSGATSLTDSTNLTFDGTNLGLGAQNSITFGGTKYLYASSTNDSLVFGENAGATFSSLTTDNVAIGFSAGRYASTSAADFNNFIGNSAGYNNTGTSNNIFGLDAGRTNTGSYNNIIGNTAGYNNIGSYNNIIGIDAGYSNTGSDNNIFGDAAGYKNTGDYNEIFGFAAGYNLQSTSSIIIGTQAFRGGAGTTAFQAVNNVALGYRAGYAAQTGASNNILIGYQAADNITTGANNIVIGYNVDIASTTRSKQLNIGNLIFGTDVDGTGSSISSGNIGVGTTTPSGRLTVVQSTQTATGGFWLGTSDNTDFRSQYMNTSGVLSFYGGDTAGTLNTATLNAAGEWTNASDISYKENIKKLSYGLDTAMALQPRSYDIKDTDNHRIGFIAQEVEGVIPEVVDGVDGSKGISYGNLVAVAISAIQELAGKIDGFTESITTKFMKAEQVETNTLCLEGLCITKSQLQDVLNNQAGNASEPSSVPSAPEISEETDTADDITITTSQVFEEVELETAEETAGSEEVIIVEEVLETEDVSVPETPVE